GGSTTRRGSRLPPGLPRRLFQPLRGLLRAALPHQELLQQPPHAGVGTGAERQRGEVGEVVAEDLGGGEGAGQDARGRVRVRGRVQVPVGGEETALGSRDLGRLGGGEERDQRDRKSVV